MKNKVKYTDEPMKFKVIPNFLSSPEDLVFKEQKKRVTITLTQKSLIFFKTKAKKHGGSYQAMIRELIDFYVRNQKTNS